jgi:hypothetical protein
MPGQCEAAAFGYFPGRAAQSARCVGFNLAPRYCELDHRTHFFRVVRAPITILAEQASPFLADLEQI